MLITGEQKSNMQGSISPPTPRDTSVPPPGIVPLAVPGFVRPPPESRVVMLVPALGILATLAGVLAAGANRLWAYLILGLGIAATATLVLLVRRWSTQTCARELALRDAIEQSRRSLGHAETAWHESPALLFRTDAAGAWTGANQALTAALRRPATDLLGHGWWARLDRRDQPELDHAWRTAIDTRRPLEAICRYATPERKVLWLRLSLAPLGDSPGFAGCLSMVDQEMALADALAEMEEHRDILLDSLKAAYFDWDVDSGEVTLSRQWSRLLGSEAAALRTATQDLELLTHPEDRPRVHAQAVAALNGATTYYHVEHRVCTPAGTWLWIESHGKVVKRAADGSPKRMIGVNRDISIRKQLEVALRDAEAHHRQVLDDMNEVIFRTDAAGNWTALNTAWTEVTGYPVDESLGRPMQHYVHPEDRSEIYHLLRGLSEGRLGEVRHELRAAGKDGFDRWLELRMRPQKDAEGRLLGTAGTMHDVTDRHRAELELRRAKETAESANRVKTDFLANVSHEIRTPLHGIMGMTDLLLEGKVDEAQREHLQLIRNSSSALLRTLNEVLDFSRIEAGKMGIELAEFALGQALETATKQHALVAARKGLTLRLKVAPEVPDALTGDARRLQQVLDHLLDNAVKFTSKGEIELTVQTRAELSERVMLEFIVRDTGSGFTSQQRDNLFSAFSQVARPEDAKKSGVGLGLAIVKRLAEMMGGEVWAESVPGRGSAFHFTARFYRPNPLVGRAMALPASSPRAEPKPKHCTGLAVLLVEDDELNQKVAASMLRNLGHYPTIVANGADAIVAWETHRFDVVLMDLQLPLMGGIEAARYIREKEAARGGHQPIIALTAHAESDYRARCKEVGISDFLVKPVEKDLLAEAVDRAAALGKTAPGQPAKAVTANRLLDLDAAKARINNDEAMFRKILELFLMGYEQPLLRCRSAVKDGDAPALATAAHQLKGMAGNIGANTLRTAATQLERLGREAHRESFADGLEAVELALAEVLPELDRELGINKLASLAAS